MVAGRRSLMFTSLLLVGLIGPVAHSQRGFGSPGGFGGNFGARAGKVVTGEPYTATVTSSSVEKLVNGTTISHTSTITEARDSQGRTYRSVATTPAPSATQASSHTTVVDPVAHTITEWSAQSTTATQFQLPTNPHGFRGARDGGNESGSPRAVPADEQTGSHPQMTRTALASQTIAGVSAQGVRTTFTIPAGTQGNDKPIISVREVWTSPDLQIVLQETSDDPRRGSQKTQVTSLTQGEPSPTLFEVPQGYTLKTETRHRGM